MDKQKNDEDMDISSDKDDRGQKEEETKKISLGEKLKLGGSGRLCRCGKSKKYPYCDGSHSAS